MPTLMFASSKPMTFEAIRKQVPEELESSIEEKLGGALVLLIVRKEGKQILQIQVSDAEANSDTMDDFPRVEEPAEFGKLQDERSLHFALLTCSDKHPESLNSFFAACAREGVFEFDASDSVRRLDDTPVI